MNCRGAMGIAGGCRGAMGIAGGLWRVETRVTTSVSFSIPARRWESCPTGDLGSSVGVQWELRGAVARRDPSHAPGFLLNS